MDDLTELIRGFADAMYWPWTVGILLATGAFFTIRTGFVQVRRWRQALREMMASQQAAAGGALSPFQTFMTGLAATIGMGNIAGVATAIIMGGPGALFWIWCYGFFAMAIKFSEAALGLKFRLTKGDEVRSGPMYYIRDGLGWPGLAWIYALVAGIACLFTTPLTQTNSVAVAIDSQLDLHEMGLDQHFAIPWVVGEIELSRNRMAIGVIMAVLVWAVIIGGVKSIGRAAEKLSPLKVGLYLIGGLTVIVMYIDRLPEVLSLVFREAFSFEAGIGAAGGISMWTALRYGLARAAYSNEAGFGTAAVVYGAAKSDRPEQQGLNAVMEVFIITYVISSISALTILLTQNVKGYESSDAIAAAFNEAIPTVGGWMVALSVFLFGYTTLMGWSFYGEQFFAYIFGPRIIMPFRWVYCALIPLGAVAEVKLVWAWGDILNGSQIFPNLIGLIALSGVAARLAWRRGDSDDGEEVRP